MKKLYFFFFLALPLVLAAQSTPANGDPVLMHHDELIGDRDFGDTITFNELISGTIISDQYAFTHGAVFSGWPQGNFCDTYDYGQGSFGPIAKSSSWFDGVRIDFVNPADTLEVVPVCVFGFNNPIDTEIDYIVVRFYDINDNLIYTYHSVSPELVNVTLDPIGAAYVTMEDENGSAYVIDDVWFEAGCPANLTENETSALLVYPNPSEGLVTIDPKNNWISSLIIFDIAGRNVKQISVNSSVAFQLDITELPDGLYFIRDAKTTQTAVVTKY